MDPKKGLEAFRVDEIRQKVPAPKQKYKQGNAILIILLAIMLGLTTGIGGAFAFGVKEVQPSISSPDEPSSDKAKIEVKVPEVSSKSTELSPLKPPLDQPTVEEKASSVDEPEDTSTPEEKVPPVKKKQTLDQLEDILPSQEVHQIKEKSPIKTEEPTGHVGSPTKPKKHVESTIKNDSTVPVQHSILRTNKQQHVQSRNSENTNSISVTHHETPDPTTKQGKLPHTAGNDLNHAVVSFALVCFSIAYFLARRENHPV